MTQITRIGIDLAKNFFQLCAVDPNGKLVYNKTISRQKLAEHLVQTPPCEIILEACASAHYWSRVFTQMGHTVKIIHPQYVRPYVKTNKNDASDAEALCEAASRPSMRFVQGKTIEQQDAQLLHRVRQRLVSQRTALANQIRGLLGEYGLSLPQGIGHVRKQLPSILEDAENRLTDTAHQAFHCLYEELIDLDKRVSLITRQIQQLSNQQADCLRFMSAPGIGSIIATALFAVMGNPLHYRNGREFSAFLGLVPRQYSSGGKAKLGSISKRGDPHTRSVLVMGAQSALYRMHNRQDRLSRWACRLKERKGTNVAAVALANKLARICWAMAARQAEYQVA